MSILGDVLGAGESLATGNAVGAAEDATRGIGDLIGMGASPQQVQQGLSQLDKALKLPQGTLENILSSATAGAIGGAAGIAGGEALSRLGGDPLGASGAGASAKGTGLSKKAEEAVKRAIEHVLQQQARAPNQGTQAQPAR